MAAAAVVVREAASAPHLAQQAALLGGADPAAVVDVQPGASLPDVAARAKQALRDTGANSLLWLVAAAARPSLARVHPRPDSRDAASLYALLRRPGLRVRLACPMAAPLLPELLAWAALLPDCALAAADGRLVVWAGEVDGAQGHLSGVGEWPALRGVDRLCTVAAGLPRPSLLSTTGRELSLTSVSGRDSDSVGGRVLAAGPHLRLFVLPDGRALELAPHPHPHLARAAASTARAAGGGEASPPEWLAEHAMWLRARPLRPVPPEPEPEPEADELVKAALGRRAPTPPRKRARSRRLADAPVREPAAKRPSPAGGGRRRRAPTAAAIVAAIRGGHPPHGAAVRPPAPGEDACLDYGALAALPRSWRDVAAAAPTTEGGRRVHGVDHWRGDDDATERWLEQLVRPETVDEHGSALRGGGPPAVAVAAPPPPPPRAALPPPRARARGGRVSPQAIIRAQARLGARSPSPVETPAERLRRLVRDCLLEELAEARVTDSLVAVACKTSEVFVGQRAENRDISDADLRAAIKPHCRYAVNVTVPLCDRMSP